MRQAPPEVLKIMTYYVVPVVSTSGENDEVQACWYSYYDYDNGKWKWIDKKPYELHTHFKSDFVRLVHSKEFPPTDVFPSEYKRGYSLEMLAAVARTKKGPCNLPNCFLASALGKGCVEMILPVARGTTRGVILVFTQTDREGNVKGIVPSSDPEIKNS